MSLEENIQFCVFDTDSMVRLCQIELGRKKAIQWVLDDLSLCVPKKVFDDGVKYIRNNDDDICYVYFDVIQRKVKSRIEQHYIDLTIKHLSRLKKSEKPKFDEGEQKAFALALQISRLNSQYVILVTDDIKATEILKKLMSEDQVGLVRNAYDLLFFIYSRHDVTREKLEIALKDLNTLSRDNSKPAHQKQKPDDIYFDYLSRIDEISPVMPE